MRFTSLEHTEEETRGTQNTTSGRNHAIRDAVRLLAIPRDRHSGEREPSLARRVKAAHANHPHMADPYDGHARLVRQRLRQPEPADAQLHPDPVHRVGAGAGLGHSDAVQLPP